MLKSKNILIVGATGSLGKALSEGFAAKGAELILLGRSKAKLEKLYDHLAYEYDVTPNLLPFQLASADAEVYMQLAEAIQEQYGELHGFIYCPAHLSGFTPIEHFSPSEWYETIQVNLNSAFLLTKTLFPFLKKAAQATALYVAAPEGQNGIAYCSAYAASKAGLIAFAESFADECENNTNIRVHAVVPPPMQGPLRVKNYPGEPRDLHQSPNLIAEKIVEMFATTEPQTFKTVEIL
jgi:short-subunit dehydrogenase